MIIEFLKKHPMVRFTITPNFRWDHEKKEVETLNQGNVGHITPHATIPFKVNDPAKDVLRIIEEHPNRYYVFYMNDSELIWKNALLDINTVRLAFVPLSNNS